MAETENKKLKGILKNSTSFDKAESAEGNKEMKWDEMNILATYHPENKDYGHMKIDEPKTPYSYHDENDVETSQSESKPLDAQALSIKLEGAHPRVMNLSKSSDESSEEEDEETEEEKAERRAFEQKRKMHYNEFQAVKLARQLMEDPDEEDEEDEEESTEAHQNEASDAANTQAEPGPSSEKP